MGYRQTELIVYGIEISYDLAKKIHFDVCTELYPKEKAEGFAKVLEDWKTNEYTLAEYYDRLTSGEETIDTIFGDETDIHEFFDRCNFFERWVAPQDIPIHLSAKSNGERRYTQKYYADLYVVNGHGLHDSTRFEEGKNSIFGIFLAEYTYGNRNKDDPYVNPDPARYQKNFEKYCRPVLEKYHINPNPSVKNFWQTL